MHIQNNELRKYLDSESFNNEEIQQHLDSCVKCESRLQELKNQSSHVNKMMHSLDSSKPSNMKNAHEAYQTLETRKVLKNPSSPTNIRKRVPALVGLGTAILIFLFVAFPQVRALGNSFLGLFRVQKITVVQFDPMVLNNRVDNIDIDSFEDLLIENITFEEKGNPSRVESLDELSQMVDFDIRLPDIDAERISYEFIPGSKFTSNINLQTAQTALLALGIQGVQLPAHLEGQTISVEFFNGIGLEYGICYSSVPYTDNCTLIIQMPSPEVNAPPDLDLEQFGSIYLRLLGMSSKEADKLASNIDWTTTMVLPIPNKDITFEEISVDGTTGTLIKHVQEGNPEEIAIIWVKDDIIYGVFGVGSAKSVYSIANSLK